MKLYAINLNISDQNVSRYVMALVHHNETTDNSNYLSDFQNVLDFSLSGDLF